jgi:hypothetical protein
MARCDYGGIDYESEEEEYVIYNFQRQTHQQQLQQALLFRLEDFSRIILLTGPEHIGKRYLLESALYQARRSRPDLNLCLSTLDLDGYEPGHGTYADYLAVQLKKREAKNGDVLKEMGLIKIRVFIFTNAKDAYPELRCSGNWKMLRMQELSLASVNGGGTRRRKADERKPVVHGTTDQSLMGGNAFVAS